MEARADRDDVGRNDMDHDGMDHDGMDGDSAGRNSSPAITDQTLVLKHQHHLQTI